MAPTTWMRIACRERCSARTQRRGAVIHTRYDMLSFIRTMELILGMHPLAIA